MKTRLSELLGDIFETGAGEFFGTYSVVLSGDHETYVKGCLSILSYDSECVILEVPSRIIKVFGDGLDISRYGAGEVAVRGRITEIKLSEDN